MVPADIYVICKDSNINFNKSISIILDSDILVILRVVLWDKISTAKTIYVAFGFVQH